MEKHKYIRVYTQKNGNLSYQVEIKYNGIRIFKTFPSEESAITFRNKILEENKQIEKDEKKKPDFSKGKIYQITSIHSNLCYIGSTVQTLPTRLVKHKSDYKTYLNGHKKNCSSHKILEFGEYEIKLIENYPCKSKIELELRETYFYDTTGCVNIRRPRTSKEEARERNRRPWTCECGTIIMRSSKWNHKKSARHKRIMIK